MRHSNVRTLIDRGRKAGLKTAEIYNALTTRRPTAGDYLLGETDGNGFIEVYDCHGQRTYRPGTLNTT